MPRHNSTYIGIAFYALEGYPMHWVIVLSTCQRFDSTVLCGTVIESVNGWVESWTKSEKSPATFAPYMSLLGVIMVEKVNMLADDIIRSISNLPWKVKTSRVDGYKYPPSHEYVLQVLLHLCKEKTITLPPRVKHNPEKHIKERLSKLQEKPVSKTNTYSIIPIVDGDVVIGRTKV